MRADVLSGEGWQKSFRLIAKLGSGGQAEVYLAVSQGRAGIKKLVVIKRLRTVNPSEADLRMFLDEARLTSRLTHANIVHTYEVGEEDGSYFIAMEYLEGQPLLQVIRHPESRSLRPELWAWLTTEILAGLSYAHTLTDYDGTPLDIVHRDVSPQNIFVTFDGDAKLVDFGIAKAKLNTSVTETGELKGKLRHIAPEQLGGQTDARSDIFSLGTVLWECITGKKLFAGDDIQVLQQLANVKPPSLSSVRSDVSPRLEAVVAKALERDPAERFQTAAEMRRELLGCIGEQDPEAFKAETAKLMRELFQAHRDEVRQHVRTAMDAVMEAPSTLPTLSLAPESMGSLSTDERLPRLGYAGITATPSSSARSSSSRRRRRRSPPVWRRPQYFAPAAALIVLGAAAVAVRHRPSQAQPAIAAPAEAPSTATTTTTTTVAVDSDPPGAVVQCDGLSLGTTPLHTELVAGPKTLTVSKAGYRPEMLVLQVVPNQPITKSVVLHADSQPIASASGTAPVRPTTHFTGQGRSPATARPAKPTPQAEASSAPAPVATPQPAPTTTKRTSHQLDQEDPWKE